MKHDASVLTFCSDFPIQENDHVAQMPTGLTTKHDLCAAIQRQITVPTYFKTGNWDHLFEILRFPNLELAPGASRNGRTILLHQDIPLLEADWFEAQTYLEILIDSIQHLRDVNQQEKAVEAENKEELIAVFPPVLANEVWKVLSHPPRWEAAVIIHTANDGEMYLFRSRTANWALVQQWLTHLNEFINEYLELYKKERCCLKIAYLRQHHGYYIIYTSLAEDVQEKPVLSSPIEHRTLTHLLTLEEVIHIVHSVYEHDHLPHNYQWYPLLMQESELDELFVDWYYSNAEEEWIELPDEMVQYTIHRGIDKDAKEVYTLQNWQDILARQDTTLEEYLAVLCVLSKDNLEAMYHRLLTLLESPRMEERWISARFLGQVHDQRAMPVIVEMLTEDIQIHANHDNDQWAFYWRCYAPKLLRQWQTEPVLHALYHALKIWREAENFFDHDFTYWMDFEASLCYELGYRDAFELVLQLPLQAPHHQFLLISMAQGYYTKSHAVSLLDECKQQSRRHTHTKTVKNDIINILATKCKLSQAQAQNLLKEYHEAFREGEIGF